MGVLEIRDHKARYVRTRIVDFCGDDTGAAPDSEFSKALRKCCYKGSRVFFDEILPDGSKVHTFVRRIGINPINGSVAIAIAVLSIREPNEKLMIEQILSVIEQFGEHMPGGFFIYKADESEELLYANIAVKLDKFYQAFTFYSRLVHEEDRQRFLEAVSPENIVKNTEDRLVYSVPFRRVFDDGIRYYRVEFVKLDLPDGKIGIVTGFKNVDEQVRKEDLQS